MKKDELGEAVIDLTVHQEQAAIFQTIQTYFTDRLQTLREAGDDAKETQLESGMRKGRIAEISDFIKASQKKALIVKNTSKASY